MAQLVPPWMTPPPDTHPVAGGDWHPHIIAHDVRDDGTVLVTWALPGLARATVRVPLASWLEGHHQPTGAALAAQVRPLLPRPYVPAPSHEQDQGHADVHSNEQGE